MTYVKQMQQIVAEYRKTKQPWPATTKEIAAWAIQNGRWGMPREAVLKKCATDIADALRETYFTDSKGRRVRTFYPATVRRQGVLFTEWDDIRTAPRKHMQVSFQQERRIIVGMCRQLKTSLDSYNDAHKSDVPIQISFDFNMDLAEREAGEAAA